MASAAQASGCQDSTALGQIGMEATVDTSLDRS